MGTEVISTGRADTSGTASKSGGGSIGKESVCMED